MELQLGLALPRNSSEGFDLNSHANDAAASVKRDHHHDSPLASTCTSDFSGDTKCKKRGFVGAFENDEVHDHRLDHLDCQTALPLMLLTSDRANEDDDKYPHDHEAHSSNTTKNGRDLVGWPPISSWRKKLCHCNRWNDLQAEAAYHRMVEVNRSYYFVGRRASNSLFVKVKMEGVGIARKVDLSLYHSFEKLKETLMDMFGEWHENPDCYKLTYQDLEGDWLLAEDVPWRGFIQSVQRLELVKNMDGMI